MDISENVDLFGEQTKSKSESPPRRKLGKRNYFNKAALCIYASDKEEAIGIKNRLHKRFSKRF